MHSFQTQAAWDTGRMDPRVRAAAEGAIRTAGLPIVQVGCLSATWSTLRQYASRRPMAFGTGAPRQRKKRWRACSGSSLAEV